MMAKETWLLWNDISRSPYMNMAVDELLQKEAVARGKVILRFYGWDRDSVSFGYAQAPGALPERANGFVYVRRPTGGGIVFHDDDLTYTLAIPPEHPFCRLDRMESYRVIHEAVMDAVRDLGTVASLAEADMGDHTKATLQCFVSPTLHDILGKSGKLAGAAQRRGHSGILHQGSISNEAADGHSRQEFIQAVADAFAARFELDYEPFPAEEGDFLARGEELATRKYASDDWNNDRIVPEASRS